MLADLHEKDLSHEMVNDGLVATKVPPLDGKVVFSAGHDYPEGHVGADNLMHPRRERLFSLGEMDISLEKCWSNSQAQVVVQVFNETMEKMKRRMIGLLDQRVMTLRI